MDCSQYVIRPADGLEFRDNGGLVKRLVHPQTVGSVNLGVSVCYLNPGEENRVHSHSFEEAYYVIQGHGEMTLEDEHIQLEKDITVYIPANAKHGHKNTGMEPLVVLCSLSPPPPPLPLKQGKAG